jgi:hypothetical protein
MWKREPFTTLRALVGIQVTALILGYLMIHRVDRVFGPSTAEHVRLALYGVDALTCLQVLFLAARRSRSKLAYVTVCGAVVSVVGTAVVLSSTSHTDVQPAAVPQVQPTQPLQSQPLQSQPLERRAAGRGRYGYLCTDVPQPTGISSPSNDGVITVVGGKNPPQTTCNWSSPRTGPRHREASLFLWDYRDIPSDRPALDRATKAFRKGARSRSLAGTTKKSRYSTIAYGRHIQLSALGDGAYELFYVQRPHRSKLVWGTATVTVRVGTLILNVQYGGWNGTPTHRTPIEERKARTEAATLARIIIKHLR